MRFALLISILFTVFGCENIDGDLHNQISFRVQETPRRLNPEGSIPVFDHKIDYSNYEAVTIEPPFELNAEVAGRGKKLFTIYCLVCHGETGLADTKVAAKLDSTPFELTELSDVTDGEIFWKILASDGVMVRYRNELTDKEAWEITAYIRKFQEE